METPIYSLSNLLKQKLKERQLRLFPQNEISLVTTGSARWAIGEFFEDLTESISGAVRLRTDSRKNYCPDLQFREDIFFESKASGRSGAIILYQCRIEKDIQFVQQTGARLWYWIWHHDLSISDIRTVEELREALASSIQFVSVAPVEVVSALIVDKNVRVVNSGAIDSKKWHYNKYGIGWTLRISAIKELCEEFGVVRSPALRVDSIPLFAHPQVKELW